MGGGTILTVGHSNGSYEDFLGLLEGHAIDVVVDVRSSPVSRFAPHFVGEQRSMHIPRQDSRMGSSPDSSIDGTCLTDETPARPPAD